MFCENNRKIGISCIPEFCCIKVCVCVGGGVYVPRTCFPDVYLPLFVEDISDHF